MPEALRRRLYEKKGYSSIFEFAAKLAGMSQEQVRLVLNLEKRFEDKPVLKNMLVNGEVSINKLARIVSVATIENQNEIANKVSILPKNALETWIRDEKFAGHTEEAKTDSEKYPQNKNSYNMESNCSNTQPATINFENGSQKPLFGAESLPGQTVNLNFEIS
ncbi:hypothetical protein IT413_01155 [Candidatus Peregrinibacteria bacterium]|nr:hypothetical protein [Candidatus Peregrinibacteria bacterium]